MTNHPLPYLRSNLSFDLDPPYWLDPSRLLMDSSHTRFELLLRDSGFLDPTLDGRHFTVVKHRHWTSQQEARRRVIQAENERINKKLQLTQYPQQHKHQHHPHNNKHGKINGHARTLSANTQRSAYAQAYKIAPNSLDEDPSHNRPATRRPASARPTSAVAAVTGMPNGPLTDATIGGLPPSHSPYLARVRPSSAAATRLSTSRPRSAVANSASIDHAHHVRMKSQPPTMHPMTHTRPMTASSTMSHHHSTSSSSSSHSPDLSPSHHTRTHSQPSHRPSDHIAREYQPPAPAGWHQANTKLQVQTEEKETDYSIDENIDLEQLAQHKQQKQQLHQQPSPSPIQPHPPAQLPPSSFPLSVLIPPSSPTYRYPFGRHIRSPSHHRMRSLKGRPTNGLNSPISPLETNSTQSSSSTAAIESSSGQTQPQLQPEPSSQPQPTNAPSVTSQSQQQTHMTVHHPMSLPHEPNGVNPSYPLPRPNPNQYYGEVTYMPHSLMSTDAQPHAVDSCLDGVDDNDDSSPGFTRTTHIRPRRAAYQPAIAMEVFPDGSRRYSARNAEFIMHTSKATQRAEQAAAIQHQQHIAHQRALATYNRQLHYQPEGLIAAARRSTDEEKHQSHSNPSHPLPPPHPSFSHSYSPFIPFPSAGPRPSARKIYIDSHSPTVIEQSQPTPIASPTMMEVNEEDEQFNMGTHNYASQPLASPTLDDLSSYSYAYTPHPTLPFDQSRSPLARPSGGGSFTHPSAEDDVDHDHSHDLGGTYPYAATAYGFTGDDGEDWSTPLQLMPHAQPRYGQMQQTKQ